MATWNEVKGFLQSNFPTKLINDQMLGIEIPLQGKDRSQYLLIGMDSTEWYGEVFMICSCIGTIPEHKLNDVLSDIFGKVIGGLVAVNGTHYLRENIPASEYQQDTFLKQMGSIARIADELEEKFVGGDKH